MSDSLPARRRLSPRNCIHALGRSIPILFRLLGDQGHSFTIGPGMNTDSLLIDEASVCTAVLVDEI